MDSEFTYLYYQWRGQEGERIKRCNYRRNGQKCWKQWTVITRITTTSNRTNKWNIPTNARQAAWEGVEGLHRGDGAVHRATKEAERDFSQLWQAALPALCRKVEASSRCCQIFLGKSKREQTKLNQKARTNGQYITHETLGPGTRRVNRNWFDS